MQFFSELHLYTLSKTLIACRDMQLRLLKVKTLLNNAFKSLSLCVASHFLSNFYYCTCSLIQLVPLSWFLVGFSSPISLIYPVSMFSVCLISSTFLLFFKSEKCLKVLIGRQWHSFMSVPNALVVVFLVDFLAPLLHFGSSGATPHEKIVTIPLPHPPPPHPINPAVHWSV